MNREFEEDHMEFRTKLETLEKESEADILRRKRPGAKLEGMLEQWD